MTNIRKNKVLYEKKESVAYITLNRPEVMNAMDLEMHEELKEIWDDFEADPNIRVGVLCGAGDKAFSVGLDLKELTTLQSANKSSVDSFGSQGRAGYPRLTERFDRVKPVIAKVFGHTIGGGFELALACDIIVASDETQFALPEAKLGLIPGAGGVFRLSKQMPYRTALGYLITGRRISAKRAFELGLVNEVVSREALDKSVKEWVDDILRCAPLSVSSIKEVLSKSSHLQMIEAFKEKYHQEEIRKNSHDALEGPKAFVEKRDPKWKGK